jgi:RNA polymerase sigma-70 factor (ECF subfamily)
MLVGSNGFLTSSTLALQNGGPRVNANRSEPVEELDLIGRSQRGDTSAFDELVTKYRPRILRLVYSIVNNEDDAWDIAQEAFLLCWLRIQQFEHRASFYTWLYSVTINVARNSLRRQGRRNDVELSDSIPDSGVGPEKNCQHGEIRAWFNWALAELSPEQRAVVILKELEGLQYREIAQVLSLSIGTVMSRLFYARKRLQSMLRPVYH